MKTLIVSLLLFASAGTCGLVPLKPLVPLGCKDLVPVCSCDASGDNCSWTWVCVK